MCNGCVYGAMEIMWPLALSSTNMNMCWFRHIACSSSGSIHPLDPSSQMMSPRMDPCSWCGGGDGHHHTHPCNAHHTHYYTQYPYCGIVWYCAMHVVKSAKWSNDVLHHYGCIHPWRWWHHHGEYPPTHDVSSCATMHILRQRSGVVVTCNNGV